MFATHQIEKEYRAIVRGHLKDRGTIDKPLAHLTSGKLQDAVTDFECLARAEVPWPVRPYDRARYSLVALRPKTGRTHQLRRHMNTCAHPIIGDTRYGDGAHNRAFRDHIGISRLFLHAHKLTFPHPRSGEIVSFVAAEDSLWQAVTQQLFARMS